MDDWKLVRNINSIDLYSSILGKMTTSPDKLTEDEKTYILTCAILLIKKYNKDMRCRANLELAYYIILKYSLTFKDYEPLFDFSVNAGFYPIADAIVSEKLINSSDLASSLIPYQINTRYQRKHIIETREQSEAHNQIINSSEKELCFIAPTSFGKSSLIIDHIKSNLVRANKIAIIVPTRSLLMQTYRSIKNANLDMKILMHDEMYLGEERFVAVFTQERALRLLDRNNISFDLLYIDEAHKMLERDSRAVLLSRLVRLNRERNPASKTIYLSPLVTNADNLKYTNTQSIFEYKIKFNIKEPEYFEYRTNKKVFTYNRFLDKFFDVGECTDLYSYILNNRTPKSFCYLYAPRKIEQFATCLAERLPVTCINHVLENVIDNLKAYVHEDFYVVDFLRKGLVYLHGKMPDNVKEYLEYQYSRIPELCFIIANKVILEGINLPIDSIFILNGHNLQGQDLTNLIGRVNRLDQVFDNPKRLDKLMPRVHFVNSDEFNRRNGKLENKIRQLKSTVFIDNVKNPVLKNFDIEKSAPSNSIKEKCIAIQEEENSFFCNPSSPSQDLKKKMIALGMNTIYNLSDDLCKTLIKRILTLRMNNQLHSIHFLDRMRALFIRNMDSFIVDAEFKRLKNDKAIAYYKMFFENRKKSLKENIMTEVSYFLRRISEGDTLMYIGTSYGELPYPGGGKDNVYIDLRTKTKKQLVNIAIVKQKLEEDFVSFKLHKFFQLMLDYDILDLQEYNLIVYGTTSKEKLHLMKMGLTINLINKLESDNQLTNICIDSHGNLVPNKAFESYRNEVDDFYRFELDKYI